MHDALEYERYLTEHIGISKSVIGRVRAADDALRPGFAAIERARAYHQMRVIDALQSCRLEPRHFAPSTGYGYGDIGREALDRVFAHVFRAQAALVRPQIASGTHALYAALMGLLRPGDRLLSAAGKPYDTLESVIGISGDAPGSLADWGISYHQTELLPDGSVDIDAVGEDVAAIDPRVVLIQRSRGYALRPSISIDVLARLMERIRAASDRALVMIDNCYCEFVEAGEPCDVGADVVVGSLIKNPGGGLAPTGAYIAGGREEIERIAAHLIAPGIGAEVGSYAAGYSPFFQGLFQAPQVVCESLKTALLAAYAFEQAGFSAYPKSGEARTDIIQAIGLKSPQALKCFCRGIQAAAPVDAHVTPEPWDMPGYRHQVIMAAGAFVQGSSIELSADAPLTAPYTVYMQGGLNYDHGRLGVMKALSELESAGLLDV